MTPEQFEKRNKLTAELRSVLDAWEAENGKPTSQFDLKASAELREKASRIEADLEKVEGELSAAQMRAKLNKNDETPVFDTRGAVKSGGSSNEDWERRFASALFSGNRLAVEKLQLERADITTSTQSSAIPTVWQDRIIGKLEQLNVFRNICPVRSIVADQKIVIGATLPTAYKVPETNGITADGTFSISNIDILDLAYAVYLPVSKQYAADAVGGINYLVEKASAALANKLEDEYTNGAGGAGNMAGLLSASIANAGDVGAGITFLEGDDFLDLAHAVAPQYRRGNVGFMMNDTVLKQARKLKATTGEYIWKMPERYSDLRDGAPSTIYGFPVYVNQAMTNANGDKGIVFGNFDYYEIYDRDGGINVMIDPYGLSTSLMNRVIVSMRTFGACTNTSAFAYFTI
jgi:HK97 family phage major capsid protein